MPLIETEKPAHVCARACLHGSQERPASGGQHRGSGRAVAGNGQAESGRGRWVSPLETGPALWLNPNPSSRPSRPWFRLLGVAPVISLAQPQIAPWGLLRFSWEKGNEWPQVAPQSVTTPGWIWEQACGLPVPAWGLDYALSNLQESDGTASFHIGNANTVWFSFLRKNPS